MVATSTEPLCATCRASFTPGVSKNPNNKNYQYVHTTCNVCSRKAIAARSAPGVVKPGPVVRKPTEAQLREARALNCESKFDFS